MVTRPGKLLIVGLELGDGQLIRSWAEAGMLPAFQRMIRAGCWGWLETTADQLHISAWPSIYTGAAPGDHGVYFTFQPAPGLQGYQRFHEGLYGRPTFWSLLDRAGQRSVIFDPPYSHAESGFCGAYIHDWGTWAHYLKTGSLPSDLIARMEKACGPYPLGLEANDLGFTALDPDDTARRLVKSIESKAQAIDWLMQERPWDALFTVFGETHVAGHYCWSASLHGDQRDTDSSMFQVYAAIDRVLGRLMDKADEAITVIAVSGDRCGPNHAGWHLLPQLLERLGLAGTGGADTQGAGDREPHGSFDAVKAIRDLLPKDFRKNLARRLPTRLRDKLAQRVDTAGVDWSRTRAFCLPTDLEGYVRVNLQGREPQGIVSPGPEYAQILKQIEDALLELRAADSDRPVVRRVIRVDDVFPGDRRAYLPDLIVQWEASSPIQSVQSPRTGIVSGISPDPRSGTHRGPGFVLASGPGIAPGTTLSGGHIVDFAPTVLARVGVAVPDTMRGRIWPELTSQSQGSLAT
jgi:predicted AlkP superfamily phosphohydrolase/phosphomutase